MGTTSFLLDGQIGGEANYLAEGEHSPGGQGSFDSGAAGAGLAVGGNVYWLACVVDVMEGSNGGEGAEQGVCFVDGDACYCCCYWGGCYRQVRLFFSMEDGVCVSAMCLIDMLCMFDVPACDGYVYQGGLA